MGKARVKEYSSSTGFTTFPLIKQRLTTSTVCEAVESRKNASESQLSIILLHLIQSTKEGNRKAYIEKYIADRYFPNNNTFKDQLFGSVSL